MARYQGHKKKFWLLDSTVKIENYWVTTGHQIVNMINTTSNGSKTIYIVGDFNTGSKTKLEHFFVFQFVQWSWMQVILNISTVPTIAISPSTHPLFCFCLGWYKIVQCYCYVLTYKYSHSALCQNNWHHCNCSNHFIFLQ